MNQENDQLYAGVTMGEPIYNEEGESLGVVRGIDTDGFYVRASEGAPKKAITEMEEITERDQIMWRCWECGAMGKIEASLPAECPECGAPREELYYWEED